jgi:hypothetical protein
MRLHGEWFTRHPDTTPTGLRFRAHEASCPMALLPPRQHPAGQGLPGGAAQQTRLTSENLAWVDEKIKEAGWARQFLISAGLLDSNGHWNPSYWPDDGEAGSK